MDVGYLGGDAQSGGSPYFTSEMAGNVIVVETQYRLGPYGFLSGSEIIADSSSTANAGLLDQRMALEWVQQNIAAFGGDPTRVTMWGGSAGGGSVTAQLILHGGTDPSPPFRAAIAGELDTLVLNETKTDSILEYPWWQPYPNDTVAEKQYTDLLTHAGCADINCLRALDTNTLNTAIAGTFASGYQEGLYGFGTYYFGPTVDGEVIRGLPSDEFAQGHFYPVPLLVDREQWEGKNRIWE